MMNAVVKKKCPECEKWFFGDETVRGELCPDCKKEDEGEEEEEGEED